MTQYMLSVHSGDRARREPASAEQMQESSRRIHAV
jgi:hypothetical protein